MSYTTIPSISGLGAVGRPTITIGASGPKMNVVVYDRRANKVLTSGKLSVTLPDIGTPNPCKDYGTVDDGMIASQPAGYAVALLDGEADPNGGVDAKITYGGKTVNGVWVSAASREKCEAHVAAVRGKSANKGYVANGLLGAMPGALAGYLIAPRDKEGKFALGGAAMGGVGLAVSSKGNDLGRGGIGVFVWTLFLGGASVGKALYRGRK